LFINLYNFMDGLDGLAASEAVFIAVLAAGLSCVSGELVDLFGLLAMCALGFLYWNRPPARIFMGDTGSYFLGFTIASLALLSVRSGVMPLACWLLLPGVFLVDATLTLIRRMLSGKRWLEAHRSHAYQHAARRLGSHAGVVWSVALLNLVWLTPWIWWIARNPAVALWVVPVALSPLLLLAWWLGAGRSD
jgi:Fuc2NAc and GlcNAc transferase